MLISSPIHAINQEEADIAIKEPIIKIKLNIIFQGSKRIKRGVYPYLGYEPKSFYLAYSLYYSVKRTEDFDSSRIDSN